jgi:nitrile hydratase subunit beta
MAGTMKTIGPKVHDLGGQPGYGAVQREPNSEVFPERWQASVFAMAGLGMVTAAWNNTDRFRHAVERIDPVAYLTHGYYGRWLGGIETLLIEAGVIDQQVLDDRSRDLGGMQAGSVAARPKSRADPMAAVSGAASKRTAEKPPKFSLQQPVVAIASNGLGHTRLPGYVWGKKGVITAVHGHWVFPDTNAHGLGECPQALYTVCFNSEDLFPDGEEQTLINLDLFEPYLLGVNNE